MMYLGNQNAWKTDKIDIICNDIFDGKRMRIQP